MASPSLTSAELYLRLLTYVKPYWHAFVASLLAMAVVAASEPALPALMKPLLDGTFVERDPSEGTLALRTFISPNFLGFGTSVSARF